MRRALWRIVVAGWMSAALTVSPVVAAMQCRVCCDRGTSVLSPVEVAPPCCAEHAKSAATERHAPCPTCPKCDAQRPNPAVAGPTWDWKPPVEVTAVDWTISSNARWEAVSALDSGRSFVDRAMPPPRVLYCTWQK